MGDLVPATIFRKWQAVINNSKCVARIKELLALRNRIAPTVVSVEDINQFNALAAGIAQIYLLTNYLLDMNQAEPLESDSVASPPTTPRGKE
jgi:hypothetical protein